MLNPSVSLAMMMHSNPGVFAMLLGSGISASAGIPTGREVVLDLVRKISRLEGEDPGEDPIAWFEQRYDQPARYTTLLDQLAPTPAERSRLLRGYFEASPEERARGVKTPSAAHRSLADLAQRGYVSLFITTNFDRLLETALEEVGVDATVLRTPDDIEGAPPLVHAGCTVLKLHGDYKDGRIKNTPEELASYHPAVDAYLRRALSEYSVIISGWSGEWDTALVSAMESTSNDRYTTWWTCLAKPENDEAASRLIKSRKCQLIELSGADEFFAELKQRVGTLDHSRPSTPRAEPKTPISDRPSLVVLPFSDRGKKDDDDAWFSEGITEDLITDLAKLSGLMVIARNTAFQFRDLSVDVRAVCEQLGVRYCVEGSVRRAGKKLRITAELIEAETGQHLWGERFDRELDDVFAIQDEVVKRVVEALKVQLTGLDEQRLSSPVPATLDMETYELLLRARYHFWRHTPQDYSDGRTLAEKALTRAPQSAEVLGLLSTIIATQVVNNAGGATRADLKDAIALAERAVDAAPDDFYGYVSLGFASVFSGDLERGEQNGRIAVRLNPGDSLAHGVLGMALHYSGRNQEALVAVRESMRVDPKHPQSRFHLLAQPLFMLEQYDEAIAVLERRIALQPTTDASRVLLAACYSNVGRYEDARAAWRGVWEVNPEYSLQHKREVLPYTDKADFDRMVDALRRAGIDVDKRGP